MRQNGRIAAEEPKREIAALERELQRTRYEAEKNEAALRALDDQRREREERLTTALRAQQELEQQIQSKRLELEVASFREALAERDAAAEAFASAARSVMLRLQEFDAAQEAAETTWEGLASAGTLELAALRGVPADDPRPRPDVFSEALSSLSELVRERTGQELERDLVEAAARSPAGNAIQNLPTHLQVLARARFFALAQEQRRKQSNEA